MELMARVKSQIRRYMTLGDMNAKGSNIIRTGRLAFDTETRCLTADGNPVRLTATATLIFLTTNP